MPFGMVQTEPIGQTVKPCHLAHGDAAIIAVVDGPRTCKCTSRTVSACAKGVRHTMLGKFEKPADGLYRAGRRLGEAATRYIGMYGPCARCEDRRVPIPHITKMPCIVGRAAHLGCVSRGFSECGRLRLVCTQKRQKPISVRNIPKSILAGRPIRQSPEALLAPSDIGYWLRIARKEFTFAGTHDDQPLARLRRAEVPGV